MPGVASAATAVVIGHVAAGTTTIRVGSGGIMLPNHSPLVVAEQFGTLESLYPDRIDLGVGRAPGSDPDTARTLRRNHISDPDEFPRDVMELLRYLAPAEPGQRVVAIPGAGSRVPVWILGSSVFGAQVAAALGLPFAFASHFAPSQMMPALETYRRLFRPSTALARPYVMLGFNIFAADSDAEAALLATSMQQAFVNLRSGRPAPLPPPDASFASRLPDALKRMLADILACSAIGAPETVATAVSGFLERTAADELLVTSQIHDHQARLRSFEIAAKVRDGLSGSVQGGSQRLVTSDISI